MVAKQYSPGEQRGSILLAIYAAIAAVALIGAVSMNVMRGPVRSMAEVTKRTIAENSMMGSAKLALVTAARSPGDYDGDGMVEPPEWADARDLPAPDKGGLVPPSIGASLKDPWGEAYGYCAWDNGPLRKVAACGMAARRLEGDIAPDTPVIAIISAGPDKVFQTACRGRGGGGYIEKAPGSDDIVQSYSFAEAYAMAGGLWNLKDTDAGVATIGKNLSVTDTGGQEQLSFNASSKSLSIGAGGTGRLPNIKTDYIQNLTENAPVEFLSDLKAAGALDVQGAASVKSLDTGPATISTSDANAAAAIVTSSGSSGVGLKASGAKAIEAAGLLDMTGNRIVNLAAPVNATDAATKAYVDDAVSPPAGGRFLCESFTGSACAGGSAVTLSAGATASLGACKKACEAAGAQCCLATFPALGNNPNAALAGCAGYAGLSQVTGSRNLLAVLGSIAAYCYRQY